MDYHGERFRDYSLLIFKKSELVAILPANRDNNSLYSHQGLTFGGILLTNSISIEEFSSIQNFLISYLKEKQITELTIKSIPEFYYRKKLIGLHNTYIKNDFKEVSSNMVLAIDYNNPLTIHKTKRKHFRNNKYNFVIKESSSFNSFWEYVLEPRLQEKHNTKPVHTLSEITMLSNKFPNQIKQFDIYLDDEILAGITIFENEFVVKSQYGATTTKGEKRRALDYLFLQLIYKYKDEGKQFFSMGTVQDKSYKLGYNPGLLKQKEELGCTIFKQPILKIEL